MSRAQDAKKTVAALKATGAAQAVEFPGEHRPRGWFENLAIGTASRSSASWSIPASLSLQSHFPRLEHWIVVDGTTRVAIDDTEQLVTEHQPSTCRRAACTAWRTSAGCR